MNERIHSRENFAHPLSVLAVGALSAPLHSLLRGLRKKYERISAGGSLLNPPARLCRGRTGPLPWGETIRRMLAHRSSIFHPEFHISSADMHGLDLLDKKSLRSQKTKY